MLAYSLIQCDSGECSRCSMRCWKARDGHPPDLLTRKGAHHYDRYETTSWRHDACALDRPVRTPGAGVQPVWACPGAAALQRPGATGVGRPGGAMVNA